MTRGFWCFLIILMAGCEHLRPETKLGPVIDGSQTVSVMDYSIGGSSHTILLRHFYYFARPAQWTILASGDAHPITLYEETVLYELKHLANRDTVVRLPIQLGLRTNGISPSRMHVVPGEMKLPGRVVSTSAGIVYLEDGPIYGIVDVSSVNLSNVQPVRLLVDGRVAMAALAADGKTVAYVDDHTRLFITRTNGTADTMLTDFREKLGLVSITGMLWEGTLDAHAEFRADRVLVRLSRGGFEQVWGVGPSAPLEVVLISPTIIPQHDTTQELDAINRTTQDITPEEWGVPNPQRFSPE